ncbi:MAG: TM2 domain-containing protein [Hyphomicrobiales bacterium]
MNDPHVAHKMMAYDAGKKDVMLAYILWFFLGSFGVHRLYMDRTFSGVLMALLHVVSWGLTLVVIGFVGLGFLGLWWLIDAFLIMGWVERHNMQLAEHIG